MTLPQSVCFPCKKSDFKLRTIKIATKQAITVFQSPNIDALPTKML